MSLAEDRIVFSHKRWFELKEWMKSNLLYKIEELKNDKVKYTLTRGFLYIHNVSISKRFKSFIVVNGKEKYSDKIVYLEFKNYNSGKKTKFSLGIFSLPFIFFINSPNPAIKVPSERVFGEAPPIPGSLAFFPSKRLAFLY